jgi:hypothetical protein
MADMSGSFCDPRLQGAIGRWIGWGTFGLLTMAAVSGCRASGGAGTLDMSAAEDIPILWQKSGTYSRISRRTRILARDPATLAQLPLTDVPVNFDTQMVLIAGLGPMPTSQEGIRIVRVWQKGQRIHVQERQIHPGSEERAAIEPASPWTVAIIPKSDLNVDGYETRVPQGLLRDYPGSR